MSFRMETAFQTIGRFLFIFRLLVSLTSSLEEELVFFTWKLDKAAATLLATVVFASFFVDAEARNTYSENIEHDLKFKMAENLKLCNSGSIYLSSHSHFCSESWSVRWSVDTDVCAKPWNMLMNPLQAVPIRHVCRDVLQFLL